MAPSTHRESVDESLGIFLVEDNPGDARLTREAFAETEPETPVHVVPTGEVALEFLSQQVTDEGLPHLVLRDLNLPGMDGCEGLTEIRATPQLQSLPVIMVTSSTADGDVGRCYDATANAYLTEPGDPDAFVSLAESIEEFWFDRGKLPPAP